MWTSISTSRRVAICAPLLLVACSSVPKVYLSERAAAEKPAGLQVMSFNIAHAAGHTSNPLGVDAENFRHNLSQIAGLLRREQPDIIGLQELDTTAPWTNSFDHALYLARSSGYRHVYLGLHTDINWWGLTDSKILGGTGVMARWPLERSLSVAFRTGATDAQGFVVAVLETSIGEIEFVSLHLNPESEATRLEQIEILLQYVSPGRRSQIITGDFNSEAGAPLQRLVQALEMSVFEGSSPSNADLATFPATAPSRRLDWILISKDLEFVDYRVIEETLADHRPVAATIRRL